MGASINSNSFQNHSRGGTPCMGHGQNSFPYKWSLNIHEAVGSHVGLNGPGSWPAAVQSKCGHAIFDIYLYIHINYKNVVLYYSHN